MSDLQPIISCKYLGKTYVQGDSKIQILHDININVMPGDRIAIVGASGAGKSTLLHLLSGLDQATEGQVLIGGHDVTGLNEKNLGRLRNRTLGFVYQFHHLLPEFTALENVSMPLLIGAQLSRQQAMEQAASMLERVGLQHRLMHKPAELSGGERQRAAIARALVTSPECVLADEPTGNLDIHTASHVYELFVELNEELNTSLVLVTHDEAMASRMDQVWQLREGQLKND
ncbi:MAG TPA: lipoprotein-releasing ABC transporter ATP-binding protein LolD [Gammaproteobacteria bacterium]|jgi:lipoprotein-releasing system ATP-binding protein